MSDLGTPESWVETAADAFGDEQYDRATAAAQIASAIVFCQDAAQVAQDAIEATVGDLTTEARAATQVLDRLAEATRILKDATRHGPRHPAIYAALDVLTGTSQGDDPRQAVEGVRDRP